MPDIPPVIAAAERFRAQLLASDQQALERLISAHVRSYDRLEAKIDQLILTIGDAKPTAGQVQRMTRYRELMAQVNEELRDLQALTKAEMNAAGQAGVRLGEEQARQLISIAATGDLGILPGLNKLPTAAIEQVLGFLDPDGPLYARLAQLAAVNVEAVSNAVVTGVSLGYNPRKIAAEVRRAFGGGLTDALRFTRTVSLWSYREATRAGYLANSDIVSGWVWHANIGDPRTCMSCVAMHGTEHPLSENLNDHYNGRCAMIPLVPGYDNPVTQSGQEWFEQQPEAKQRQLMGAGKYDAWKAGKFEFSQLSGVRGDPAYGSMRVENSLKALLEGGGGGAQSGGVPASVFTPAKTREEAIKRLEALLDGRETVSIQKVTQPGTRRKAYENVSLSGVGFDKLGKDQLNSILKGLEGVAEQYRVKFSYIDYQFKPQKSWGLYTRHLSDNANGLTIQKTFLQNAKAKADEGRKAYLALREKNIAKAQASVDDPKRFQILDRNKARLESLKAAKRWAVMNDAADPIEAVARHEAYHGVFYQNDLEKAWSAALAKYEVTTSDWFSVSEYGASKASELFPEVGTAIDLGFYVPERLKRAFLEVVKGALFR